AGIESHWALIYRSTSILPMIYDDFVSPRFNHAIIYIPKENLWLECTSKNLPLGYIGVDNMDRKALVIKENDGYLADTPKSSMFENKYYSESEVVINDNASAKISIQFEYSGTKHDNVRYYIDNLNDLQKEKYINGLLIVTPQAYETIEMKYSPDTPKASIFTKFDIHKIGNYSGNRLFFNTNSIEKLGQIVAEDSLKSDTFELNNDYEDEIKITYHLPQKFVIENVPYKEKIKQTPFIEYYSKVEINDSKIIFYRKCKFIKGKHNKELFKEYANTLKEVNKWENSKIVLSPNR
ncbi:MAG TPA: hypothetical protein PKD85_20130, partial [Saprospiraceae bacterium]|nr:hypothetical protein [Saprospiraceae bacterium]